jgi:hypothetical protein
MIKGRNSRKGSDKEPSGTNVCLKHKEEMNLTRGEMNFPGQGKRDIRSVVNCECMLLITTKGNLKSDC